MIKVVLAGPPRSGKSCLREALKQAIRMIPGAPYPYVITACPDGEGAWFQEAMNQDESLARACKAAYKSVFTPEFVRRVADNVRQCAGVDLVLVDIGGRISAENEAICAGATHMLIISGDPEKFSEWRAFAFKLGLTVVAEVYSDYNGTKDSVRGVGQDGIFRGSVHHLERGEPAHERPTVRALAELLVRLVADEK